MEAGFHKQKMEGIVAPKTVVFEVWSAVGGEADVEKYGNELKFKFVSEEFEELKFQSGRDICRNLNFGILDVSAIHVLEEWEIAKDEASKPIKRKFILQNALKIMW